jgi:hypothetical protein
VNLVSLKLPKALHRNLDPIAMCSAAGKIADPPDMTEGLSCHQRSRAKLRLSQPAASVARLLRWHILLLPFLRCQSWPAGNCTRKRPQSS